MGGLTKDDLDMSQCDAENCAHDHSRLYFVPICHPQAGIDACYIKATGLLELTCRQCDMLMCRIAVAQRMGRVN